MSIGGFSAFPSFLESSSTNFCFVDTSILFSATYPLDKFNAESEAVFESLAKNNRSILTNQNVRSEFLENHRRVLLAEALIDFYEDRFDLIPQPCAEKLKSHRTNFRRKVEEGKDSKLNSNQIKEFREILSKFEIKNQSAWYFLCEKYLEPLLSPLWDSVVSELRVDFLSSRASETTPLLDKNLNWSDAISLMGRYGIASSDAMILNMFLSSKIPILITADKEMAQCIRAQNRNDKYVFIPDSILKEIS